MRACVQSRIGAGLTGFLCSALGLALLVVPLRAGAEEPRAHPRAAEVVILAADGIPASVELAHDYAAKRGIPAQNIIRLPVASEGDAISRPAFVEQIYNPTIEALVDRGLIEGVIGREPDAFGRKQLSVLYNRVRYLVICRPLPYKIHEQPGLDDQALVQALRSQLARVNPRMNLETFFTGPMAVNRASVDAELATIPMGPVPLTGIIPNPLYRNNNPGMADSMVLRVTRLDGPSYEDARALVDRALEGEAEGLRGRAYVDLDQRRNGGYAIGNEWLENVRKILGMVGYDADVDERAEEFAITDRFDAPVLYFGWYEQDQNGPFRLPGFRFPPGAVAAHIHSGSAANLRSPDRGWVGPLVRQGVAATVGNTSEPYLAFTHNFDSLLAVMADGGNFGDAAYASLVCLSWQNVAIGDPLYQPFKTGLDAQVAQIGSDPRDLTLDGHVVVRRMIQLENAGRLKEALDYGIEMLGKYPSAALAYAVARREFDSGELRGPRRRLAFTARVESIPSDEWMLYARIARLLRDLGEEDDAFAIFRNLLANPMPDQLEMPLLREAIPLAREARERDQGDKWTIRLGELEFAEAERKRLAEEERLRKEEEKRKAEEEKRAAPQP